MQKKIPMRQCLGCREMKPKKELIRVVRSPEGALSLDFRGKAPGRGAYVCESIECLKKAGMEIKDIRQFMDWCVEGAATYPQRKALLEEQKAHVEAEIERLQKSLDMIRFKCWFYEQLMRDGDEARVRAMLPDHLPADIQKIYDHAHET